MLEKTKIFKKNLDILLDSIDPSMFPITHCNSLYIANYCISYNDMYVVTRRDNIFPISKLYTKHGALALVKCCIKHRDRKHFIQEMDKMLYFNSNKLPFYKHVLETATDGDKLSTASVRFDVTLQRVQYAKNRLKRMIN